MVFGQGQPGLDAEQRMGMQAQIAIRAFGMGDAMACRHQIDRARFDPGICAKAVAVVHLSTI